MGDRRLDVGRVDVEAERLTNPHAPDAVEAERGQRPLDRRPFRIGNPGTRTSLYEHVEQHEPIVAIRSGPAGDQNELQNGLGGVGGGVGVGGDDVGDPVAEALDLLGGHADEAGPVGK